MFLSFNTQSKRNMRNYNDVSNISDREKVAILKMAVKMKKAILVLIVMIIPAMIAIL